MKFEYGNRGVNSCVRFYWFYMVKCCIILSVFIVWGVWYVSCGFVVMIEYNVGFKVDGVSMCMVFW